MGFRPHHDLESRAAKDEISSEAYSHFWTDGDGTMKGGQTFAPHEVGIRYNAAGEYPPNGIVNLVQVC